ncbi:double-strand-break repair protein rad21-like protein 1 [Arapaima gigas]
MFYTQIFTSKRGPLAKIWLAAHWEKKITKTHVFECNLEATIMDIISPQLKIGLRISGHLLLGVVRIYSQKTKYLLADCNEAVLKIRVAFRPGLTDLPSENTEAAFKAITLPENFADFELQLPDVSTIEVVDHFMLNQCRSEDITLKEDYGDSRLVLESDFGNNTSLQEGSFHSLTSHADGFGDDGGIFDFLDFMESFGKDAVPSTGGSRHNVPLTPPPTAEKEAEYVETTSWPDGSNGLPALDETTLVENTEEAFALEPVSIAPTWEKKRSKRKRRLLVDQEKDLSNEAIMKQLEDYSELEAPLDMAPPTRQLLEWKDTGGVHWLFCHSCVPLIHPQLQQVRNYPKKLPSQLFPRDMFLRRWRNISEVENLDPEEMREQQEGDGEVISMAQEHPSLLAHQLDFKVTKHNTEHTSVRHPVEHKHLLDSPDLEEKKMNNRVQNLLHALKKQKQRGSSRFHLHELCQGNSSTHLATTFFCLLVLHKQGMVELQQEVAYGDIIATPGLHFPQQ